MVRAIRYIDHNNLCNDNDRFYSDPFDDNDNSYDNYDDYKAHTGGNYNDYLEWKEIKDYDDSIFWSV